MDFLLHSDFQNFLKLSQTFWKHDVWFLKVDLYLFSSNFVALCVSSFLDTWKISEQCTDWLLKWVTTLSVQIAALL